MYSLYFYYTKSGDVYYGVNNEDKGLFFSGLLKTHTLDDDNKLSSQAPVVLHGMKCGMGIQTILCIVQTYVFAYTRQHILGVVFHDDIKRIVCFLGIRIFGCMMRGMKFRNYIKEQGN